MSEKKDDGHIAAAILLAAICFALWLARERVTPCGGGVHVKGLLTGERIVLPNGKVIPVKEP